MATSAILRAREQFRERRLTYLLLFIGWNLFSWFFLLSAGFAAFLIYGVGLAVVLYVARQPVHFFCPKCEGHTGSRADWKCDFCQFEHRNSDYWYSFIYPYSAFDKCKACGKEPHFLKCWKCSELAYFTTDSQKVHEEIKDRLSPTPPPDPKKEQEREREAVKHKITMARLNNELEHFLTIKSAVDKSPKEQLEESFAKHKSESLAVLEIARREKASNAEQFKNDPDIRKRADASVDEWMRMRGI